MDRSAQPLDYPGERGERPGGERDPADQVQHVGGRQVLLQRRVLGDERDAVQRGHVPGGNRQRAPAQRRGYGEDRSQASRVTSTVTSRALVGAPW